MPQANLLPDGRLHLNHGPIDLIIQAWGSDQRKGYAQATTRFQTVLPELAEELPLLRRPHCHVKAEGVIARAMTDAIAPHSGTFITPMSAVAGAVADEICRAMCDGLRLDKALVNNGGDIAIHLQPGNTLSCAIHAGTDAGKVILTAEQPARGVATSGWGGRSHSFGIADAVTVIAPSAAQADVAATLIANAVNLPNHPLITRQAANALSPDSDLGARMVTTAVGLLTNSEVANALTAGQRVARDMVRTGKITAVALFLRGQNCYAGETLAPTGEHHARLQTA